MGQRERPTGTLGTSRLQTTGSWSVFKQVGGREESESAGEFWRCTLIESETRLRAARGIAKSERQAAIEVFEQLRRRGHKHSPPSLVSDGWGGYDEAMVEAWWKVAEYKGRGRPPTKKRPQESWQYLKRLV